MKLAKYLADYIAEESILLEPYCPETGEIELIIQQGIEAFASTENVMVAVHVLTLEENTVKELIR